MESTTSKILVVLIALLVAAGGGYASWYVFTTFFTRPAPNSQNPSTTYNYPGNTTTSGQTQTGTQGGGQTTANSPTLAVAIADAFGKLSATPVTFAKVDSTTGGGAANIYALYAKDVALSKQLYPDTKDFSLMVGAVDLNNDGTPEALVYENLEGFCGIGGCTLDIYQDQQDHWVKIASVLSGGAVGIAPLSTGGYKDLYLPVYMPGGVSGIVRYAWDGKEYQSKGPVAAWNGSAYVLPR